MRLRRSRERLDDEMEFARRGPPRAVALNQLLDLLQVKRRIRQPEVSGIVPLPIGEPGLHQHEIVHEIGVGLRTDAVRLLQSVDLHAKPDRALLERPEVRVGRCFRRSLRGRHRYGGRNRGKRECSR